MIFKIHYLGGKTSALFKFVWLPLLIGFIGLLPFYTKKTFLGDLGDARFNMYVMEHGYQAMKHRSVSFWNAPIFYPHQNVIAYSDHHLGNLPIYSAFRVLKCRREAAFQYWQLASLALTYFSGYLALRSFGAQRLAAGLAAYVFAFGLPVIGQIGHFQLLPRYLLPWVFVCTVHLTALGRTRDFAWLAFLMVWQLYIGIYEGIFTGVILASFLLTMIVFGDWRETMRRLGGSRKEMVLRAAIALLALLALLPIALPYLHAAKENGMRSFAEISTMVPRLSTWVFAAEQSLLWNWMSDSTFLNLKSLPMQWEHRDFVGITMVFSFFAFPFLKTSACRLTHLAHRAWWAILFCVVISLSFWNWTFWQLLALVPGVGAIRGVARIVLYLLFPMAMVMAAVLNHWIDWARAKCTGVFEGELKFSALGVLLAGFVIVDSGVRNVNKVSFTEALKGVKQIKATLKQVPIGPHSVFWVCQNPQGTPDSATSLNAMLASQDLGIPTLNGYSGCFPPGYPLVPVNSNEEPQYYRLKRWLDLHAVPEEADIIVLNNSGRVFWDRIPDYSLGTLILFTKERGTDYIGRGFWEIEKEGIWTNRKWASIPLKLSQVPQRDLIVTINLITNRFPEGQKNTIRMKVNGSEISSRAVAAGTFYTWEIQIPQKIAGRNNGILRIEVGSDLIVPICECDPKNKDPRAIGIFLKTLSIK